MQYNEDSRCCRQNSTFSFPIKRLFCLSNRSLYKPLEKYPSFQNVNPILPQLCTCFGNASKKFPDLENQLSWSHAYKPIQWGLRLLHHRSTCVLRLLYDCLTAALRIGTTITRLCYVYSTTALRLQYDFGTTTIRLRLICLVCACSTTCATAIRLDYVYSNTAIRHCYEYHTTLLRLCHDCGTTLLRLLYDCSTSVLRLNTISWTWINFIRTGRFIEWAAWFYTFCWIFTQFLLSFYMPEQQGYGKYPAVNALGKAWN